MCYSCVKWFNYKILLTLHSNIIVYVWGKKKVKLSHSLVFCCCVQLFVTSVYRLLQASVCLRQGKFKPFTQRLSYTLFLKENTSFFFFFALFIWNITNYIVNFFKSLELHQKIRWMNFWKFSFHLPSHNECILFFN